jgi:hypothetical protein
MKPDQLQLVHAAMAQLRFWLNVVLPVQAGALNALRSKLRK